MRNLSVALVCLSALLALGGTSWASHPPEVFAEAKLWALDLDKEIAITYFPCSMASNYCAKLGILGFEEGFYKAYFTDGFVLTLTGRGKVLESYYEVPQGKELIFKMHYKLFADMSDEEIDDVFSDEPKPLRERMKARIKAMRDYAEKHGKP